MSNLKIQISTFLLGFFSLYSLNHAASFDCGKAKTVIEKSICADAKLSSLDDNLSNHYSQLRSKLSDNAKQKLRDHQSDWIRSLSSICSATPSNKDSKQITTCLSSAYTSRIEQLQKFNQGIHGITKYPTLGKNKSISYELLDQNTAAAQWVNNTVEKIVATSDLGEQDLLNVKLTALGRSMVLITANVEFNGGAHPDFSSSYRYLDIQQLKELKTEDFFIQNKWPELAKFIVKKMFTGADQETKDCYSGIDESAILETFKTNLSGIEIGPKKVSILLGVPRYCRNNDFFDIDNIQLKSFVTERFKSIGQ